ncbi:LptM family lipoprotein [Capnocytophaga gingivalis]|jgi:lipoprotein
MKRIFLLVALVTSLFASSACGKKDDTTPVQSSKDSLEQKLIGKWKSSLKIDVDAQGNKLIEMKSECFSLEFFPNGKGNWLLDPSFDCQDGNNWAKKSMYWKIEGNYLIMSKVDGYEESRLFKLEMASVNNEYFEYYTNLSEDEKRFHSPNTNKVVNRYIKVR